MTNLTSTLTLTQKAADRVRELYESDPDAKGRALRIKVQPGGCSGWEYAFLFDDPKADDSVLSQDGFKVVVDPQSAKLLAGAQVDYFDDVTASGFKITNPNAKASCGCGTSFKF